MESFLRNDFSEGSISSSSNKAEIKMEGNEIVYWSKYPGESGKDARFPPKTAMVVAVGDAESSSLDDTSEEMDMNNKKRLSRSVEYKPVWELDARLRDWISPDHNDISQAYCKACRKYLRARKADLISHAGGAIHKRNVLQAQASQTMGISRTDQVSLAEIKFSIYCSETSSISGVEKLIAVGEAAYSDSDIAKRIDLCPTKCTCIIRNVLYPHLKQEMQEDVKDCYYSLFLHQCTSKTKHLGVAIKYFSLTKGRLVSSFLCLAPLERFDASALRDKVHEVMDEFGLDEKYCTGIGTDNASVRGGVNNVQSLYALLRQSNPDLFLVRCVCHSIQLAASHAAKHKLPFALEQGVNSTYTWFSRTPSYICEYYDVYRRLHDDFEPHELIEISGTRWLSLYKAVKRVFEQWNDLRDHFRAVTVSEDCGTAEQLVEFYENDKNRAYLASILPILEQVNKANSYFQVRAGNAVSLHKNLVQLLRFLWRNFVHASHAEDEDFLSEDFSHKINFKSSSPDSVTILLRNTPVPPAVLEEVGKTVTDFTVLLFSELKQRLSENMNILTNMEKLAPSNVLAPKEQQKSISDLVDHFSYSDGEKHQILQQFDVLSSTPVNGVEETDDLETFWYKVFTNYDECGYHFKELALFAFRLLSLPNSNAEIERVFSSINKVTLALGSRLANRSLNARMFLRAALRRSGYNSANYPIPNSVVELVGTNAAYNDEQIVTEEMKQLVDIKI